MASLGGGGFHAAASVSVAFVPPPTGALSTPAGFSGSGLFGAAPHARTFFTSGTFAGTACVCSESSSSPSGPPSPPSIFAFSSDRSTPSVSTFSSSEFSSDDGA